MDADAYAHDTQMHSQATNNHDGQSIKIDEMDSGAQLRRKILPELLAQSTIDSDPTAHACGHPSRRNRI